MVKIILLIINRSDNTVEKTEKERVDEQIVEMINNSFIGKYANQEGITDISFNGTTLWLQHNQKGRMMADYQPTISETKNIIRQIQNAKNLEFTNSNPTLNTDFGFLRVNAIHETISPEGMTFAIRVSKPSLALRSVQDLISDDDVIFEVENQDKVDKTEINKNPLERLFEVLILARSNIVVSGGTGSGKTEFQKTLVGFMDERDKITLIEDTRDSHIKSLYPHLDINSWQTVDGIFNMSDGLEEGLRNNPDWIMPAETRDVAASGVLDAVKTDHAIITTLHSSGAKEIPTRFIPMIKRSPEYQTMSEELLGKDITNLIPFGVYLKLDFIHGRIQRNIEEIFEFTDFSRKDGAIGKYLYRERLEFDSGIGAYMVKKDYNPLSEQTISKLKNKRLFHLIPDVFIPNKGNKEKVV